MRISSSLKLLPIVVLLVIVFCVPGCYEEVPEELDASGAGAQLNISTRSISADALCYPITIFAFDKKGVCKAKKEMRDGNEVKLTLPEGNYHITAIAGTGDTELPSSPSLTSNISLQSKNYSTVPIAMGHAEVAVKGNSNATIQMTMKVASVEMELEGLSDDVSAVKVTITKQNSKVAFDGTLSEPTNTEISCKKEDDVWKTGKVYVLQGAADVTTFSIMISDKNGSNTYGYTYNSPLKSGIPYSMTGSFSSGFTFNGTITTSGWNEMEKLEFVFGPGIEDVGSATEDEVVSSSGIPRAASIWNGHVVALVENVSAKEADVLLISRQEWKNVGSKNTALTSTSKTTIEDPANLKRNYYEEVLEGWDIPTNDEATSLRTLYSGENLPNINNVLSEIGGDLLSYSSTSGDNTRYLCEDAGYTFSFKNTSKPTTAGAKTKYLLRLVKWVHVKVE